MLAGLQAQFACHLQAAINSFNFLCKRPLAALTTAIVIAVALALPALFWVFTDNLSHLTIDWQRGGHISLYLKSSLPVHEEAPLIKQVESMEGVGDVMFKSNKEGLLELQQQEGMEDIMRYLPENPLPAVLDVVPSSAIDTPVKLKELFDRLHALPQIEQAKLDMEWIGRLHAVLSFVAKIAHGLMILLGFAVILIVGNTLRLTIYNRHEEIQLLKLIGASDAFIIRPFLYSGIWYGLVGAIVAVLLVNVFMFSVSIALQELASVYQMHYALAGLSVQQAYTIVLLSVALGWIGARVSVKRQLASIEPYS